MNPDSPAPEPVFSALLSSLLQRTEGNPCSGLLWLCQNRIKPPWSRGRGSGGASHLPFWFPTARAAPCCFLFSWWLRAHEAHPAPEPVHRGSPLCCSHTACRAQPATLLTPEVLSSPCLLYPSREPACYPGKHRPRREAAGLPGTGRGAGLPRVGGVCWSLRTASPRPLPSAGSQTRQAPGVWKALVRTALVRNVASAAQVR